MMRRPRRAPALAVALLAALAATALAQSSPPIKVTVFPKVTPNKAGTPAHPQGVHLDVRIKIDIPESYTPPLVKTIDVWFPKGGLYNGGRYPTCSRARLNADSPAGCPAASIMGHGGGVARADANFTYPRITVVNGGQHEVLFYTVLNNPARVQEAVPGIVTRLSGRWSYRLHVTIPRDLQIVAGVPIVLHSLHISAGHGNWIATTYCPPSHKWAYHAITRFNNGQVIVTDGTVGCR
jgi:hypothetical protein